MKDEAREIIEGDKEKQNTITEKHEDPKHQPPTYDKADPNTGNPRDTLIKGKEKDMKELKAVDRVVEELKGNSNIE